MKTQKRQKKKPAEPHVTNIDLRDWCGFETERMGDQSFILEARGKSPTGRDMTVRIRCFFDNWINAMIPLRDRWNDEKACRETQIIHNEQTFGNKVV